MTLKEAYTGGARAIALRSMTGLARTRVTPNMLTAAGVTRTVTKVVLSTAKEGLRLELDACAVENSTPKRK